MSSLSVRVFWETLRKKDAAALTGGYDALGSVLANNPFLVKMVNDSTATVEVSIDGVNSVDVCPKGSFWLYDEGANASREGGLSLSKGTQVYVKGAAGVGNIYLVVQYAGG